MYLFENVSQEVKTWFLKIILPALVGVAIKVAVQSKQEKITLVSVIWSFVAGVGSAYVFGDYVMTTFSHQWQPLIIAVVAISGEKIGTYLVYDINVKDLLKFILRKK
jgi:hypothetical protein